MIRRSFLFVIFLFVLETTNILGISQEPNLTPVVKTTNGPVQGAILETIWEKKKYSAFRGIRYAEPPTGYNRFKPPIEAKPWKDVYLATEEGNVCPQIDFVRRLYVGDEDCLNLNLYTPWTSFSSNQPLKPTVIYIHSGYFSSGYAKKDLHGPDFFIENDIVVVIMNYRLGALGFLGMNHPNATGNAGLKDQLLAMKWAKANIQKFGGDPNNITLMGHSSGAVSVDFHVLSKASKGLFHRSASFSGSVFCPWAMVSLFTAESRAFRLGGMLGHIAMSRETLLEKLYETSAVDLVVASKSVTLTDFPFVPTIENSKYTSQAFIDTCPSELYDKEQFTKQPHLMGYMADEALIFMRTSSEIKTMTQSVFEDAKDTVSVIPIIDTKIQNIISVPESISANIQDAAIRQFTNIFSDLLFKAQIDLKQKKLASRNGAPVYYYSNSFNSEYNFHRALRGIVVNGSAHLDDIGFVFNTEIFDTPTDPSHPYSVFRKMMIRLLSNFIKYGEPTPLGKEDPLLKVYWPPSGSEGTQADLNLEITINERLTNKVAQLEGTAIDYLSPIYTGCGNVISIYLRKILNAFK